MSRAWPALAALLAALPAAASPVRVEFPLGPYYRAGRYVPVQITFGLDAPTGGALILSAQGAVDLEVRLAAGEGTVVAPWLMIQAPADARWRIGADGPMHDLQLSPLRELGVEQALVAVVGEHPEARQIAAQVTKATPILIERGAAAPLPGPATAWEMLDAVVMDRPTFAAAGDRAVSQLLAGGTSLIVRADEAPDARWTWERHGAYQVARADPAGLRRFGPGDVEGVLQQLSAWTDGLPGPLRGRIALYGALAAIALLGVALVRWRWTPAVLIVAAGGMWVALATWWRGQTPLLQRDGAVEIVDQAAAQIDTWIVQRAIDTTGVEMPWRAGLRPLIASPRAADAMRLTLVCREDGRPTGFRYVLPARRSAAFMWRQWGPASGAACSPAQRGPLLDLARQLYQRKSWTIQGQIEEEPPSLWAQRWPRVVVRRG